MLWIQKKRHDRETENRSLNLGVKKENDLERTMTGSPLFQLLGHPLPHLSSCPYSIEVLLLLWNDMKLSHALTVRNVILHLSKNLHE